MDKNEEKRPRWCRWNEKDRIKFNEQSKVEKLKSTKMLALENKWSRLEDWNLAINGIVMHLSRCEEHNTWIVMTKPTLSFRHTHTQTSGAGT